MAVVFISPKQKQKVFFMGITVILLLFLASLSFGVFTSKPKEVSSSLVFNKPKVDIDMHVFDTDQFKDLHPFPEMKTLFMYKTSDKKNKVEVGYIPAYTIEEARAALENMQLTIVDLKEAEIGRDNPFTPYYQLVPALKK